MSRHIPLIRAFRHPLVILSILVLLLNDHVLKASTPSWLTGKLSDFAGLFFFPFLLGVGIQAGSWLFQRHSTRRISSRTILFGAILLTGALFTVIKTVPSANAVISGLLTRLLGMPTTIVLDPSDLIALVVFLPAREMWKRLEAEERPNSPGKLAYAVLGLGALASLATSPCPPILSIQRLAVHEGTLYANSPQATQGVYASVDLGKTWTWMAVTPIEIRQAIDTPAAIPLTLCDPAAPLTCYRLVGQAQIEESEDGGLTWREAWSIPAGRKSYMIRAAAGSRLMSCGKIPDFRPFDMIFVPGTERSTLLVAMGNEGFLIHSRGQGWERTAMMIYYNGTPAVINYPRPTPFNAISLIDAIANTRDEWPMALGASFLIFLGLSLWAWIFAVRHRSPLAVHNAGWVFRPALVVGGWILLLFILWLTYTLRLFPGPILSFLNWSFLFVGLVLPILILVVNVVIWLRAGKLTPRLTDFSLLGLWTLLFAVVLFGITWGWFILWAFGIILTYELALVLSTALGLGLLAGWVVWMRLQLQQVVN